MRVILQLTLILLLACTSPTEKPEANQSMQFKLDLKSMPSEVVTITGVLRNSDFDVIGFEFTIDTTLNTAKATVEQIPIGDWTLTVNAYDADLNITHTASTNLTIETGLNEVGLVFEAASGDLVVNVGWDESSTIDLSGMYDDDNVNLIVGSNGYLISLGKQETIDFAQFQNRISRKSSELNIHLKTPYFVLHVAAVVLSLDNITGDPIIDEENTVIERYQIIAVNDYLKTFKNKDLFNLQFKTDIDWIGYWFFMIATETPATVVGGDILIPLVEGDQDVYYYDILFEEYSNKSTKQIKPTVFNKKSRKYFLDMIKRWKNI